MEIVHDGRMVTTKYKEYVDGEVNHFDYYNIDLFSLLKIDDIVQSLGYKEEVDYHLIDEGNWVTLKKMSN